MNKKANTAIIITLILISLTLTAILIFVLLSANFSPTQNTTHTYIYKETKEVIEPNYYPIYYSKDYRYSRYRDYPLEIVWSDYEKNYKSYGAYRDRFLVRVKNNGDSDYVYVKFYLQDYSGDEITKTVEKYLRKGETQTFSVPNYGYSRYHWDYKTFTYS